MRRRRRAEWVLLVRTLGYGATAISLVVTGAAGLIDGNAAGIAGPVAGGIAGALAGLFGYVAFDLRRKPSPLRPSWTSGFDRVRSVTLGISASVVGIFGLVAIVFGLIGLLRGRQFAAPIDVGIFLLAVGAMSGTTAWALATRGDGQHVVKGLGHPNPNMAKAAVNLLTRMSAQEMFEGAPIG